MSANNPSDRIEKTCWVCGSHSLVLFRQGVDLTSVRSQDFNITNSAYGLTGEIHRCLDCGFLQCSAFKEVLQYYRDLEDPDYEKSRPARSLQARKLVEVIHRCKRDGRLLDIGAGSGILVEQAIKSGYSAEGVEPSTWLQSKAQGYGLPVYAGSFPNPAVNGRYDVICLVDVLEHIPDPIELLREIPRYLNACGILVLVTPDVHSFAAKLLGPRWWHFRIAHVGYFDQRTLDILLQRAGFRRVKSLRASWHFSLDYLWVRLHRYLPGFLKLASPSFFQRLIIPLDLGDSMMVFYAREESLPGKGIEP